MNANRKKISTQNFSATENTLDAVNKIQDFWVHHYGLIADKIKNSENVKSVNLNKLLSDINFTYLRRSRSIVGRSRRNIHRLEIWCTVNVKSIQTHFDQCPYLHLYFQTKNYHQNKEMDVSINTESSNIYTTLLNECQLFDEIILLIIEYVSHEDTYCLLSKNQKSKGYEFENNEETIISLEEYVGVSDTRLIEMIMKSIGLVFEHYCLKN